jgi:hypothetical protein
VRGLLGLLLGAMLFWQPSTLDAQPASTNRVLEPDGIRGKLRRFDQSPHVVVPVQLLDHSNQIVQTQLSGEDGGYGFTNVSPGTYRVRCHVLGGFRYHGLDRVLPGTLTNAGPEVAGVPAFTLQAGSPIKNADFTFAPFKKGTWKTYNFRDGLAGNEVRKILPLDDGTVWIATMSGLSIFDGSTFKNLRKEDGLPDNRIFNLHREPSGAVWICTGNGVARFDPSGPTGKQIRSYTSADGLIPGQIHAVCQTLDGVMWFGYYGLSRFDGRKFVTFPMTNLPWAEIYKMTASKDGSLWIGMQTLVRFDGTNFTAVTQSTNHFGCDNPAVGPDGAVWFGGWSSGLLRHDPRQNQTAARNSAITRPRTA